MCAMLTSVVSISEEAGKKKKLVRMKQMKIYSFYGKARLFEIL
jgi:hypothetical protein